MDSDKINTLIIGAVVSALIGWVGFSYGKDAGHEIGLQEGYNSGYQDGEFHAGITPDSSDADKLWDSLSAPKPTSK